MRSYVLYRYLDRRAAIARQTRGSGSGWRGEEGQGGSSTSSDVDVGSRTGQGLGGAVRARGSEKTTPPNGRNQRTVQ